MKKRRERRSAGGRRGLILALSGPHKTTRKTESGSERDGGQKVVTEAATAPTEREKSPNCSEAGRGLDVRPWPWARVRVPVLVTVGQSDTRANLR